MFEKVSATLDSASRTLMVVFLIIMTAVLSIQIVLRYFFQTGIIWSDELARFLMIALIYIGAASAIRDNSHITVSVFEDRNPALRKWLGPIQWVVVFVYSLCILKFGFDTLKVVGAQSSANMGISMGWVYAVLPLSALITIIHQIARIGKKPDIADEEGEI